MIEKKHLLQILQKYRMNEKNIDPYLYENKKSLGLYYSIFDPIYGNVCRVKLLSNLDEAEQFVFKLWWYKRNYQEKSLRIELLDDSEFSDFNIILKDTVLSLNKVKDLDADQNKVDTKRYTKLVKSAFLLLEVANIKMKLHEETKATLETFKEQVDFLQEDIMKLREFTEPLKFNIEEFDQSLKERFDTLAKDFKNYEQDFLGEENISVFMKLVWEFISLIEGNESYLHNKYMAIKLPLLSNDLRIFLNECQNEKFKLFKKKEKLNPNDYLIEANKIVSYEMFKNNELKRLQEKFSIIEQLEFITLGDYLVEFDNLNITMEESSQEYEVIAALDQMVDAYSSLSETEQHSLILYHSILNPIFKLISNKEFDGLLSRTDIKLLDSIRLVLNHVDNVLIRLKYFKEIDISSNESIIESVKKINSVLKDITFQFIGNITVYFKGEETILDDTWIDASFVSLQAPSLHKDSNVLHIVKLNKDYKILYLPFEINISPYEEDHILVVNYQRQGISFKNEKQMINNLKYDIIKVNKYRPIHKANDIIVRDMVKIGENHFKIYQ